MKVFTTTTLPRYLADARRAFPQIDDLSPSRRSALISLVLQPRRGAEGHEYREQDRKEMRNIRRAARGRREWRVAAQFELMTRLWDPAKERGLIQRRRDEAAL